MIIQPLLVTVLAYNELFSKIALGPLCMNYTLWEDPVVMGVLCAPRPPLDSYSRLDGLGFRPMGLLNNTQNGRFRKIEIL